MNILCATDLSPKTAAAMDRAGLLADRLDATLHLLHVVDSDVHEVLTQERLQSSALYLKSRVQQPFWRHATPPNVMVRAGKPSDIIIETADEHQIDLVVLGPHRQRGGRDALASTIAEQLLRARHAPVLVVNEQPRGAYRRILLALDFSEASADALRAAESYVLNETADAAIVHAFEPPYEGMVAFAGAGQDSLDTYARGWDRVARSSMLDFLQRQSGDANRYQLVLKRARPAPAILGMAERMGAELVVMGTRGHGRWRSALLGSTAKRILHAAPSDVLIVPEGSFEPRGTASREAVVEPAAVNA
jgi:nucleotide-binding universal stress UspA family protein